MLHASPFSMGIAAETGNVFWIFDGYNSDIVRYDFVDDHGPGNDDHSDGILRRYKDFTVQRDGDVPSHLVLDKNSNWLYIVDNGNDRVLRLDISSGSVTSDLGLINEPLAEHSAVTGATWEVIIDSGLERPCGIEIMENRLMVSDYATGDIVIYDIDNDFAELGRIETLEPGITGLKVGPDGSIWYTNRTNNALVRVELGPPVSTTNLENQYSVRLTPNPTNDILNIKLDIPSTNDNVEFRLFDLAGKSILGGNIEGKNHQLNLSDFPKGAYMLNVYSNDFSLFEKVILQ